MFESFGFETLTAPQAAVWFGLALGVLFGALAQWSRFCLRRAVAGPSEERSSAAGTWLAGLGVAILGTQAAVTAGWIDFAEHRYHASEIPVLAIALGGLMFGAGMVLTRGCISRLTVLTGQGNLRALTVILVFALVAQAALKGALAPLRVAAGSFRVDLGVGSLADLPGGAMVWAAGLAVLALAMAWRSAAPRTHLAAGAAIGGLAALGWAGTGFVLYDDFDPVALQSLSFTAPSGDSLFWAVAATAVPANFGVALVGGTLLGSFIAAALGRQIVFESFTSPAQTGRYLAGAVLMGLGGVLAGGCTVGAGLSGVPTLGLSAILALGAIIVGGVVTARLVDGGQTTPALHPAE